LGLESPPKEQEMQVLEMNTARIFCYSPAGKGFPPFSGASHALER
jgi:hypothetical protein